ncbi:MAG: phosphoribosylamine--glycine ligase [Bacteroidia bacterium]|nr:phosphoribosylamine--glycine ligase [Bacteroidia bacterium]
MNVLILGSGGREHVLAWKASQSAKIDKLYVAPGNAGTLEVADNVSINVKDFKEIGKFCVDNKIDIVVPGSEDPLVEGIVDFFRDEPQLQSIYVFGPDKQAAQLEGSKEYAKEFMLENDIPTAGYRSFTSESFDEAKQYIAQKPAPYVLKADGLAAGKGVVICDTLDAANQVLEEMLLDEKFGSASSTVVIEDFLQGIEFSIFAMSDGENYIILPEAKDYKRIGEGDTGLNTGGMGAVSPVPFMTEDYLKKVEQEIIAPTFDGLRKRNMQFVGFVFFGLINDNGQPKVIEYNVRMGDPETEVVFPRIASDFGEWLELAKNKRLKDANVDIRPDTCTTVFTVSGGYPEAYEKGKQIQIDTTNSDEQLVFHAGTKMSEGDIVTSGGRVIAVSAFGKNIPSALEKSYQGVKGVQFDAMYYRTDIGKDLINL